ncbi:MAG: diaminopimelate epimerase [Gammaproteobacteria bacterium]|nr:diaminopimelate epimerase [Gammaproteobacteria bacterium]
MKLIFWKMQGLGNDFVVINSLEQKFSLTALQIKKIADRHFGVGCDQLLVLEKARNTTEDFFYRIFNADGCEVGQCGNGARCMGLFICKQNLFPHKKIKLGTLSACVTVNVEEKNNIEVEMGSPVFLPEKIPFLPEKAKNNNIKTSMGELTFFALSMGNPHAVIIVPDVSVIDVDKVGKEVSLHPAFPEQANVIFMELFNPRWVKCRIYERGTAETLACGSGACAAVVAGMQTSLLNGQVLVTLPGGNLEVKWEGGTVYLKGPAEKIFEGIIDDLESFVHIK